jgi:lactoylglutathione lyase
MKGITSIGHVAIRVKDFDRSLEFYVGKLGFSEMFRLDRDGRLWIIYLRVTDDQYLELFSDATGDRAPATEGVGLNHLCLTVDDIDAVIDQLAATGIPLTRPKKMAIDRNNQAWIEDPDGNRIELMQMAIDCLHVEAIKRLQATPA